MFFEGIYVKFKPINPLSIFWTYVASRSNPYVISTDTLVEKVHFFGKESPEIIAKKSLRTNISDLSAMGAEPLYYNLSLSVPKNKINTFIIPFSKGLK